jgi:hypothetical protein
MIIFPTSSVARGVCTFCVADTVLVALAERPGDAHLFCRQFYALFSIVRHLHLMTEWTLGLWIPVQIRDTIRYVRLNLPTHFLPLLVPFYPFHGSTTWLLRNTNILLRIIITTLQGSSRNGDGISIPLHHERQLSGPTSRSVSARSYYRYSVADLQCSPRQCHRTRMVSFRVFGCGHTGIHGEGDC